MKKITFVLFTFLAFQLGNAQQTISFEASEGFSVGDINGQNGWVVTGCGEGCFIENQSVSNDFASDGTNALKVSVDPAFGPQNLVMGGFYEFAAPVEYETAIVSYDIYITGHVQGDDSDFRFGVTGEDALGGLFFTFLIDFNFQGNIRVVNDAGTFVNIGTWVNNTWYNVRAEVTGSNIKYFVDDVEVLESVLLDDFDFTGLRFVHDNYGGDAYLDNLRINDEELSVNDNQLISFSVTPNPSSDYINIKTKNDLEITKIRMVDVLGKTADVNLTNNTVDISQLAAGMYLLSVETATGSATRKIIKN